MNGQRVGVLLIEDNEADAHLIEEFLTGGAGASFDLERVGRSSAGLERLARGGVDVVLLDLGLPDSQGLVGLAAIRDRAPTVPVLILTGLDAEDVGLAAVQQGAQDYLIKGQITRPLLVRAIRYAIERQHLEEALRRGKDELSLRVRERTAELERTNEVLRGEIAERRRAEETLRASEEQFRAIFETALVGIAQSDPSTGRFLRVNGKMCEITGYSAEELLTRTMVQLTHPEDREFDFALFQEAIRGEAREYSTEKRCVRKDGRLIWVQVDAMIPRDSAGRPVNAIKIIQDVTDRKLAEDGVRDLNLELAQRVSELQTVLDAAPIGIWVAHDAACQRVTANKYAGTVAGAPGRADVAAAPGAPGIPAGEQPLRLAAARGEPVRNAEVEMVLKDGRGIVLMGNAAPLFDAAGQVRGAVCAMVDVTEQKRAEGERRRLEAQIQHAQKLESLGVLAGGIAHDFNNLLTAILGNASLALTELAPEAPARPTVRAVENAALRAADLVRQMLAYAGKGRFVVQPIHLSRVVEEMAHLLRTIITKKAVLRFDFAPDLPTIDADATQVRQVVMNLITNASDAIGDRTGVITLRTGLVHADRKLFADGYVHEDLPEGFYVCLEAADTGCGMDRATREKIFDPFFTTKFTGRGLGLAAVLGIVRGHRGTIRVVSEPKRGTTFQVLFPCSGRDSGDGPTALAQDGWRGAGTILVVDDEEHVRALAKRMLERVGFQVMLAADGRAGLDVYRRHGPEIAAVLLDLNMPHLNGAEAYHEIKLLRPDVRVVLMSGYNEREVSDQFAGKGLAGFVQKPFRVEDLVGTLRRSLEAAPAASAGGG